MAFWDSSQLKSTECKNYEVLGSRKMSSTIIWKPQFKSITYYILHAFIWLAADKINGMDGLRKRAEWLRNCHLFRIFGRDCPLFSRVFQSSWAFGQLRLSPTIHLLNNCLRSVLRDLLFCWCHPPHHRLRSPFPGSKTKCWVHGPSTTSIKFSIHFGQGLTDIVG